MKNINQEVSTPLSRREKIVINLLILFSITMVFLVSSGIIKIYDRLNQQFKPSGFSQKAMTVFIATVEYPMPGWKQAFEGYLLVYLTMDNIKNGMDKNTTLLGTQAPR